MSARCRCRVAGLGMCACGRTGAGRRPGRPAPDRRGGVREDRPRGISSRRKRPITSPWPSVLISSPDDDQVVLAPGPGGLGRRRWLWSVTAIAPRPLARRGRCRSAGSTGSRATVSCACAGRRGSRPVGERIVACSWRVAPPGQGAVEAVELVRDRREACPWASASARSCLRSRILLVLGEPRPASARASSAARARRAARRSHSLTRHSRAARGADRRAPGGRCWPPRSRGARASPSRAVRTCTRSRSGRGIVGRPVSGFVRSRMSSQSGSSASSCSTPRTSGRSSGRHSSTIELALAPATEHGGVDTLPTRSRSDRGSARRGLRRRLVVATSASSRPRSRSRCARPGGYDRRSGERRSRPSLRRRPAALGMTTRAGPARTRARRRSGRPRGRARGSRARRRERRFGCAVRSAPPARARRPRRRDRRAEPGGRRRALSPGSTRRGS